MLGKRAIWMNEFNENKLVQSQDLRDRVDEVDSKKIPKDIDGAKSSAKSETLIECTRAVWEPLYEQEITDAKAGRIIEKFAGILDIAAKHRVDDKSPSENKCGGISLSGSRIALDSPAAPKSSKPSKAPQGQKTSPMTQTKPPASASTQKSLLQTKRSISHV